MEIESDIAQKHWRLAALEQIARDFSARGYVVRAEAPLGDHVVDLVAEKDGDLVAVEILTKTDRRHRGKDLASLRDHVVRQLRGRFEIRYVSPPHETQISVENIEQLLEEEFRNNPGSLGELATHVSIEEVGAVEIESVNIASSRTTVSGCGTVYINMQYGSDGDYRRGDGVRMSDSYPFSFEVVLGSDMGVEEVVSLEADTSSFYE